MNAGPIHEVHLNTMEKNEGDCGGAAAEHAADLAEREAEVGRREAALADRLQAAEGVLAAAALRDAEADDRDDIAVQHDRDDDRAAFVSPDGEPYGHDNAGRRHAAMDRSHAKDDRISSAGDRQALTQDRDTEGAQTPED